ncbi:MAG TPA: hypothetical protein VI997_01865 [Candidatus Thermoplasmatota archaeon]|nr:hypothetical protein [Candidatus Thermoplasmatota archaeon]
MHAADEEGLMRSIRARKADKAQDKPRRGGGLGFGAMRGGDQRSEIGRTLDDDLIPGRQTKHAGERNAPRRDLARGKR